MPKRVAEADWKQPSFGREMYLGNFQLDLIHPQPKVDPETIREGEEFLGRLRAFLTERVDPLAIEENSKLGDDVIQGLKDLGALGMKIPREYGGLGLTEVYYNRPCHWPHLARLDLDAPVRPSVDRAAGAAEELWLRGAEARMAAQSGEGSHLRVPAHRARRRLRSARMSAPAVPTDDGAGYTINGTKLWATNCVIADVVVVMAVVPKTNTGKGGITAFICLHRRHRVRPRGSGRRVLAARRRQAARHAHQPDLRRLHGDHASDDRPRGG